MQVWLLSKEKRMAQSSAKSLMLWFRLASITSGHWPKWEKLLLYFWASSLPGLTSKSEPFFRTTSITSLGLYKVQKAIQWTPFSFVDFTNPCIKFSNLSKEVNSCPWSLLFWNSWNSNKIKRKMQLKNNWKLSCSLKSVLLTLNRVLHHGHTTEKIKAFKRTFPQPKRPQSKPTQTNSIKIQPKPQQKIQTNRIRTLWAKICIQTLSIIEMSINKIFNSSSTWLLKVWLKKRPL